MARFAIFYNHHKRAQVEDLLPRLLQLLQSRGATAVVNPECSAEADYAISLGGDGTFLDTARRIGSCGTPIIGVNMGRLGFLADVAPQDIEATIDYLCQGRPEVEERTVLEVSYSEGVPQSYPFALNEVAVLKRDISSMISVRVEADGQYLATYQADGLIVNSPTGSTGYALSAGGPILSSRCGAFGLVAVAPHSLNVRPITLPDAVEISLQVTSRSHHFLVSIDGRSEAVSEGIALGIRKAAHSVRVVRQPGASLFRTLRHKLLMGSDVRVGK